MALILTQYKAGYVKDVGTGAPISGVTVALYYTMLNNCTATTNEEGLWIFSTSRGIFLIGSRIIVNAVGDYETREVYNYNTDFYNSLNEAIENAETIYLYKFTDTMKISTYREAMNLLPTSERDDEDFPANYCPTNGIFIERVPSYKSIENELLPSQQLVPLELLNYNISDYYRFDFTYTSPCTQIELFEGSNRLLGKGKHGSYVYAFQSGDDNPDYVSLTYKAYDSSGTFITSGDTEGCPKLGRINVAITPSITYTYSIKIQSPTGCTISINNQILTFNSAAGTNYTYTTSATSVNYSISHSGYETLTGILSATQPYLQNPVMKPLYTYGIGVTSPTGCTIVMNGTTVTTSSLQYRATLGTVVYDYETTATSISYSVSKTGYTTKSGTLNSFSKYPYTVSLTRSTGSTDSYTYTFTFNNMPNNFDFEISDGNTNFYKQIPIDLLMSGSYIYTSSYNIIAYRLSAYGYQTETGTLSGGQAKSFNGMNKDMIYS